MNGRSPALASRLYVPGSNVPRIPVLQIGGGFLKAVLPGGQETVFGHDWRELVGRLKLLPRQVLRVDPQRLEQSLQIVRRK
jgi:hypothetical protein